MLDKEKKVQGIAVYAEFKRTGQTMQIIVTPDSYSTSGALVPMTLVRRVVTKITPKKQWKTILLRQGDLATYISTGNTLEDSQKESFTEGRTKGHSFIFDEIVNQGWQIEKHPVLIEMSRHDADDISKGKTPNKIIYRVNISRKALGFPELVAA